MSGTTWATLGSWGDTARCSAWYPAGLCPPCPPLRHVPRAFSGCGDARGCSALPAGSAREGGESGDDQRRGLGTTLPVHGDAQAARAGALAGGHTQPPGPLTPQAGEPRRLARGTRGPDFPPRPQRARRARLPAARPLRRPSAVPPRQQALRMHLGDHPHQPGVRRVAHHVRRPKMTTALLTALPTTRRPHFGGKTGKPHPAACRSISHGGLAPSSPHGLSSARGPRFRLP